MYRGGLEFLTGGTLEDRRRAAHALLRLAEVVPGDEETGRQYREAVAANRVVYPPGDPNIAHALTVSAIFLRDSPRYTEAEPLFREAYEIEHQVVPTDRFRRGASAVYLGKLMYFLGRYDQAEPLLRESVAEYQLATPPPERSIAWARLELGRNLVAPRQLSEAEAEYLDCVRRLGRTPGFSFSAAIGMTGMYEAWDRAEPGKGYDAKVSGLVSNIHAVIPEQLSFNAPSTRSDQVGVPVNLQLTAASTVGRNLTFGASGLPNGLCIDPANGLISGAIAVGADVFHPYQFTVTVTNGSNPRLRTIEWSVTTQWPGDFSGNGIVDAGDFVLWRKNGGFQAAYNLWRTHFGLSSAASVSGDFNDDGAVDAADCVQWRKGEGFVSQYNAWRANFGPSQSLAAGSLAANRAPTTAAEVGNDSAVEAAPRFRDRVEALDYRIQDSAGLLRIQSKGTARATAQRLSNLAADNLDKSLIAWLADFLMDTPSRQVSETSQLADNSASQDNSFRVAVDCVFDHFVAEFPSLRHRLMRN